MSAQSLADLEKNAQLKDKLTALYTNRVIEEPRVTGKDLLLKIIPKLYVEPSPSLFIYCPHDRNEINKFLNLTPGLMAFNNLKILTIFSSIVGLNRLFLSIDVVPSKLESFCDFEQIEKFYGQLTKADLDDSLKGIKILLGNILKSEKTSLFFSLPHIRFILLVLVHPTFTNCDTSEIALLVDLSKVVKSLDREMFKSLALWISNFFPIENFVNYVQIVQTFITIVIEEAAIEFYSGVKDGLKNPQIFPFFDDSDRHSVETWELFINKIKRNVKGLFSILNLLKEAFHFYQNTHMETNLTAMTDLGGKNDELSEDLFYNDSINEYNNVFLLHEYYTKTEKELDQKRLEEVQGLIAQGRTEDIRSINPFMLMRGIHRLPPLKEQETVLKKTIKDLDSKRLGLLDHPFILNVNSKYTLLKIDSKKQQTQTVRQSLETMTRNGGILRAFLDPSSLRDVTALSLKVRRTNLIEDTMKTLSRTDSVSLKKPLKVILEGEPGQDEGGVRKEYFLLLVQEMYDPKFGMFEYFKEKSVFWFRKGSLESPIEFELFGCVLGLAIYNQIILDIHFPRILYDKLLTKGGKVKTTLNDLNLIDPLLAKGMQELLDYKGNDVEEVFQLNFSVNYDFFGDSRSFDLISNGSEILVNKSNKNEYVRLYCDWFLNESVHVCFSAFKSGFDKVVGGSNMSELFTGRELELLVCGSRTLDFSALQKNTIWKEGFSSQSAVAKWFWDIVINEFSEEEKRKLLHFITGSDRAPPSGLGGPESTISILKNGNDDNRLPQAHTCFNILLLPEYSAKSKLKRALALAIDNYKGFGLI